MSLLDNFLFVIQLCFSPCLLNLHHNYFPQVSAADAIERVMLAFKEVNELAGYTHNVYEMLSVFKDMKQGNFVKGMASEPGKVDIRKQRGVVIEGDYIKFEDVPIVSPAGDILVEKMNFEIRPGMHLLITGPNG